MNWQKPAIPKFNAPPLKEKSTCRTCNDSGIFLIGHTFRCSCPIGRADKRNYPVFEDAPKRKIDFKSLAAGERDEPDLDPETDEAYRRLENK